MFKIVCSQHGEKRYVMSGAKKGSLKFTPIESQATNYTDLGQCKVVRDDALEFADSVTVLKT